ncbi:hypothetical protein HYZ97_02925 [Candidatus Pacearchaeota archaeon]|nr:hypothetical protein [Candidatus Pacearchaeota archaeon]
MKKGGFEFSFTWIFSLLVGAAVIALAIYGVSKLIGTERTVQDTQMAQELQIILSPLHTSVESGNRPKTLTFPSETRMTVSCSSKQPFGEQRISIASRSALGEEWQSAGVENVIRGQYLFSEKILQGREIHVLVQPFFFPYKVTDSISIWSGDYCFVNPERNVEEILGGTGLNVTSIRMVDALSQCSRNSTRVCFVHSDGSTGSTQGCDTVVNTALQQVKKKGKIIYYEGSLLYGAIFSDPEVYECTVQRVMLKTQELAGIYAEKSNLLSGMSNGCSSALGSLVQGYQQTARINNSRELSRVEFAAAQLARQQQPLLCALWKERYL